jgi:uroporphyrinogen decarboxylase
VALAAPSQVSANVRDTRVAFKPGGGYIFNNVHNIQGEVPPENVVALFDTAHECGFYS